MNHRSLLPRRNAKDLAELPAVVRDGMQLSQVDSLDDVLAVALLPARTAVALLPARTDVPAKDGAARPLQQVAVASLGR